MSNRVNVDQLLTEFRSAAETAGFTVECYGEAFGTPLLVGTRLGDGSQAPKDIYASSGIHGDEPASPLAMIELLRSDALPRARNCTVCPCMNPAGLTAGTRENPDNIDSNCDFTDFVSDEIRIHRAWVDAHVHSLDLAIHLHKNWEATAALRLGL
ncbi:MAG: hypothetical protein ACN4GF_07670 [Lentimonas sp.]